MDGLRSRTEPEAPRPDLPIWERTPRAVPPQLGAPPPIGAEGKPKRLTAIGLAAANQGTMARSQPVTAAPRTPWGVKPVAPANGRGAGAASLPGAGAWPGAGGNAGYGIRAGSGPSAGPVGSHRTIGRPFTRRRLVAVGAGAVVVVLAVAATAMALRPETQVRAQASTSPPSKPSVSRSPQIPAAPPSPSASTVQPSQGTDQSPVTQALANLSAQPLLHYTGLAPDGASWQLTVTSSGEAQGAIDLGGGELGVLKVGGRTYFKAVDSASVRLLGTLPSGMPAASVRGKWVTGDSALETLLPSGLASAGNLAASLQSALTSQDTGFPPSAIQSTQSTPSTQSTQSPQGDPATPVTTSAGVLYISTTQPYRVLRLVPPTAQPGQPTEIDAVAQTTATAFFAGLIDQTKTLTDALDLGVVFQYGEDPQLYCSDSTCTVSVNSVVASAPTDAVVVDVTARVTVGRQPAGQCEMTVKLSVDRPKNLSCQDPDAAAVVQSLGGGADLTFNVGLEFQARTETQTDVDALVAAEVNDQS
ncbi:hypothetical protein ABH935_008442 [Catenulispora sp. GAS73]|uniref:hypothetical protein n=1 Tax=Catenulispora sp. GAS73 TaxID=3156269 RepID=UPI0035176C14